MEITLKELIEVNSRLGGSLRSDSSLDFAESQTKGCNSAYRCAAIWARAIIVDHPFTDANKRTALYAIAKQIGIKDQKKMAMTITRIASQSIADLNKIVEMLKNANR